MRESRKPSGLCAEYALSASRCRNFRNSHSVRIAQTACGVKRERLESEPETSKFGVFKCQGCECQSDLPEAGNHRSATKVPRLRYRFGSASHVAAHFSIAESKGRSGHADLPGAKPYQITHSKDSWRLSTAVGKGEAALAQSGLLVNSEEGHMMPQAQWGLAEIRDSYICKGKTTLGRVSCVSVCCINSTTEAPCTVQQSWVWYHRGTAPTDRMAFLCRVLVLHGQGSGDCPSRWADHQGLDSAQPG